MDSGTSGSPRPLGGGPMRMSDLDHPTSDFQLPPRRLKPILSPLQKKKKKRRKIPLSSNSQQHDDLAMADSTPTLMNQDMLSQLRARLEQPDDYQPVVLSTPTTPTSSLVIHNTGATPSLPTTPPPLEPLDVRTPGVGEEGTVTMEERRHRKKKRKRAKVEETGPVTPPQLVSQDIRAVETGEEPHSESPLPPPEVIVEPPSLERVPPDVGMAASGRQLPDFPMGPEASTEFPRSSVAMQPHILTSFHADGPMQLISEEDVVSRPEEDKDILTGPHYKLPSSKPNPFISHSKEVIFVERKDGRGFVTKRRDEETMKTDVEISSRLQHEVTGIHIALHVHTFLQRLALMAHGLIAGLSLWDCVVLNLLSQQSGHHLNILEHYHPLTLPSHALHFLLLTLVLLSLIDRFDFARMNKKCLQDFVRSLSQVILLAVLFCVCLALVVTLSVASTDERVALFRRQPTLWQDVLTAINITTQARPPASLLQVPSPTQLDVVYVPAAANITSDRVTPLLALAILKAVCCGLSWLAAVWISSYDRLQGYLIGIIENLKGRSPNNLA